jgi:hypothetical protein
MVLGFLGFASLILGRTFLKGPHGGLLRGIGIGLFIETFIQNYFVAS